MPTYRGYKGRGGGNDRRQWMLLFYRKEQSCNKLQITVVLLDLSWRVCLHPYIRVCWLQITTDCKLLDQVSWFSTEEDLWNYREGWSCIGFIATTTQQSSASKFKAKTFVCHLGNWIGGVVKRIIQFPEGLYFNPRYFQTAETEIRHNLQGSFWPLV